MTFLPDWHTLPAVNSIRRSQVAPPLDRYGAKSRAGGRPCTLLSCLPPVPTYPRCRLAMFPHPPTAASTTVNHNFNTFRVARLRAPTATHPHPRIACINKSNKLDTTVDARWSSGRCWYKYDFVDPAIKFVEWRHPSPCPTQVKYESCNSDDITDSPGVPVVDTVQTV